MYVQSTRVWMLKVYGWMLTVYTLCSDMYVSTCAEVSMVPVVIQAKVKRRETWCPGRWAKQRGVTLLPVISDATPEKIAASPVTRGLDLASARSRPTGAWRAGLKWAGSPPTGAC